MFLFQLGVYQTFILLLKLVQTIQFKMSHAAVDRKYKFYTLSATG